MKNLAKRAAGLGLCFWLAAAPVAFAASVAGRVLSAPVQAQHEAAPVAGAELDVRTADGKLLAKAVTDKKGRYKLLGLAPGSYVFHLSPLKKTDYQAKDFLADLPKEGLCVNWQLRSKQPSQVLIQRGQCVASVGFWKSGALLGAAGVAGLGSAAAAGTGSLAGGLAAASANGGRIDPVLSPGSVGGAPDSGGGVRPPPPSREPPPPGNQPVPGPMPTGRGRVRSPFL